MARSKKSALNRRNFLQSATVGAATLAANVLLRRLSKSSLALRESLPRTPPPAKPKPERR